MDNKPINRIKTKVTPVIWWLSIFVAATYAGLAGGCLASNASSSSRPADVSSTRANASESEDRGQSNRLGELEKKSWPGVAVDHQRRVVDVDATVVLREGAWLELLGCSPNTRTHESILAIEALPSHIHLALITIGVNPGAPMSWGMAPGQHEPVEAHGDRVSVHVVLHAGQPNEQEVDVRQWVLDRESGDTLPDNQWLFTGSIFQTRADGQEFYRADLSGSVLSIVNFGDEVLARATDLTNENDQKAWIANTAQIPEIGTPVVIRMRPVE